MCSDDVAISVRNLTKSYRIFGHPGDRIKHAMMLGLRCYHKEFTALKDVSFDICKGEAIGIVGRNGSGKSTLLQLICGILKPTSGLVMVKGRVLALLELGAGFNPEFTGRENVYFQGALIGLTQAQMAERFDEIAEFADIGEFIDQPVWTYSSGMFVRLAFSIATALKPDVLVVDEAISVGDAAFQAKCFARIRSLNDEGATLLFVTHSMNDMVRQCDRALLLDTGKLIADGSAVEVTNLFLARLPHNESSYIQETQTNQVNGDQLACRSYYRKEEYRWGMGGAEIRDCSINVDGNPYIDNFPSCATVSLSLEVVFTKDVSCPVYGLVIKTIDGIFIYSTNSLLMTNGDEAQFAHEGDIIYCAFTLPFPLNTGSYLLSVGVSEKSIHGEVVPLDRRYDAILITASSGKDFWGLVDLNASFAIEKR